MYYVAKLCAKILVVLHIITKQTEGTLIYSVFVVLVFLCLLLPWQRIVKVKWRLINKTYVVNRLDDWVKWFYVLISYDKNNLMNCIHYFFLWILINCGFYGNRPTTSLALYLKMLVLVTTISVPKFMLVSKSAQFLAKSPDCISFFLQ